MGENNENDWAYRKILWRILCISGSGLADKVLGEDESLVFQTEEVAPRGVC